MEDKREIINYEYRFSTTPEYKVMDEEWVLHDVFLKSLDNGCSVFVPVFRKIIKSSGKITEEYESKTANIH